MERVVEGGSEQIRTAVEAFAELCLATRPQNPFSKMPPTIKRLMGIFIFEIAKIRELFITKYKCKCEI